ncbi:glutamyl aminopeptidase-like [Aplysia californica]|uniref:Glutamyl aminopeptidase-like n=1 Tax=Aplysia californica TaxID=6500 RepID=A0ABM1W1N8_APLCA|nr:glutamyl aminopeptidase-like [Aplysia californica]
MVDDALLTTHPIVVDVTYPDEISAIFDTISYQKGASVLQMLQNIMEQEGKDFYKGIHTYLEAHKAKNAITNDLWTALSKEIVTPNIREVMDTWTLQEGYPLVNIELTEDDGQVVVHATQTRFTSDPADSHTVSSKESKWYISLDWITSEHERKEIHYMPKTDAAFKVNVQLSHPASWVKFNVDTKGFYRVDYPSDMWKRLSSHLLTTDDVTTWRLTASDRSGLLSDAFTLAQVGQVTYDIPLGLAKYLTKERNYVPWASAVADGLQYISSMMQLDPHYELWEIYVRSLVNPVLDKMGWMKTGSHLERQVFNIIISLLYYYDHS